jgi:prophage antirepressor-like protein
MNDIQIFENSEFGKIRTLKINGEPWFVGKDIAENLGYTESAKAVRKYVDSEDKGVSKMDTPGGKQDIIIINESGLYSLVLSSKLPTAKQFKRWVTSEVLPSIRKHGAYMSEQVLEEVTKNPDFMIGLLQKLKAEKKKNEELQTAVMAQSRQISEMKPKASYYDIVLNCKDLVSVTQIAKDYGKSAQWLNNFLAEKKIQFKRNKNWLLYQKYSEAGYASTKTQIFNGRDGEVHTSVHTYWTQKGRLFLYGLLKQHGVLPIIEKENHDVP